MTHIHQKINQSVAWKLFQNHHYLPLWEERSIAFSRILFGLLISARSIHRNTIQSKWGKASMGGNTSKCVLLIETNNKQRFELDLDWDTEDEYMY